MTFLYPTVTTIGIILYPMSDHYTILILFFIASFLSDF